MVEGVSVASLLAMMSSAVMNETRWTAVLLGLKHPDVPWFFMATPAHAWSVLTDSLKVCAKDLANLSMHEGPSYVNTSASVWPVSSDYLQVLYQYSSSEELQREVSEMARLSTYSVIHVSFFKMFLAQQELPCEGFFRKSKIPTQKLLAPLSKKLCCEGS